MSEKLYVLFQEGNSSQCNGFTSREEAESAASDLLLRGMSEHSPLAVYVCKAITKYSPDQKITLTAEKLD